MTVAPPAGRLHEIRRAGGTTFPVGSVSQICCGTARSVRLVLDIIRKFENSLDNHFTNR